MPESSMPPWARSLLLVLPLWLSACVEPDTLQPVFIIEDAHSSGSRVVVDPKHPLAASGGLEGTLALWDLDTGKHLVGWKGHQGTVNGLALLASRGLLVSGSWDGTLAAWNLEGRLLRRVNTGSPITAMVASKRLSDFWTGHWDGSLRHWNDQQELVDERRLPGSRWITAMAMAGNRLAVADRGGGLWLFEGEGEAPRLVARLRSHLRALEFRPGGAELYGGSWFHLYRWNLDSAEMTRMKTPHFGIIVDLAWSPAEKTLMSISRQTDSAVLELDPATGASLRNFGKHDLCGASVAVSGDGRYLVTTSDDASVRIWHLGTVEDRGGRQ